MYKSTISNDIRPQTSAGLYLMVQISG